MVEAAHPTTQRPLSPTTRTKRTLDVSRPGALRSVGADQIAYYRTRAPWYDDAYTCTGDYDRGPTLNAQWLADLATIERALASAPVHGTCVELGVGPAIGPSGSSARWTSSGRLTPHPRSRGSPRCAWVLGRARSSSKSWISGSGSRHRSGIRRSLLLLGTRPRPDSAGVARRRCTMLCGRAQRSSLPKGRALRARLRAGESGPTRK